MLYVVLYSVSCVACFDFVSPVIPVIECLSMFLQLVLLDVRWRPKDVQGPADNAHHHLQPAPRGY